MYVASKSWIEIDGDALRNNLQAIRTEVYPTRVMAVVKANAYGHGIEAVASCLQNQPDWYGVDSIEEAAVLRAMGIMQPILVLGFVPKGAIGQLIDLHCVVVASSEAFLELLAQEARTRRVRIPVHCKWDTGLHRQGFDPSQATELAARWAAHPDVDIQGHCTHFAGSEDRQHEAFTQQQQALLERCIAAFPASEPSLVVHSACTSAMLLYPNTRTTLVRLGIGLYGYFPSAQTREQAPVALQTVLTWKTRVAQLHSVPAGDTVGYDRAWTAARPSRIALLPIGYWDGYGRALAGTAVVLIRGMRAPIVGRICMNMCMCDVTDIPDAAIDDEVVLLGAQGSARIDADTLGEAAHTISYELLTRINPLIPRIVQNA